jgi:tetratricopeptide (TPR) repeat protein
MAAAQKFYQGALSTFRASEDPWGCARSLTDLGSIDCEQGDYAGAHAAYREALEIFAGLGHRRGIARALEGSACLSFAQGHAARALTLAAAAATLRRQISAPLPQADQSKLDRMLLPAWKSLSEKDGNSAWEKGSAMSLEDAIQYSLEEPKSATSR